MARTFSASKPWTSNSEPPELFFTNARVIDPADGSVSEPRSVLLSKGKIAAFAEARGPLGGTTTTIDLHGRWFLCPGLIDCHVHITATAGEPLMRDLFAAHPDTLAFRTAWNAKQMLLRGFTTVRDTGGANSALREAIAEGLVQGPRLFIAGKALSQTGGHGDFRQAHQDDTFKCCSGHGPGLSRVCDGVPACLEAARDELRRGADFLKIMVGGGVASPTDPLEMLQFTPEEIQAITYSAKSLGKYVTAHAYTNEAIRLAVENGVTAIEHANFIDQATAKLCAENHVFVTPTLVTYKALISPPYEFFLPEDGRVKCQTVIDSGVVALTTLHEAGVTMCYGTDLLAGMAVAQNQEFEIRAEALSHAHVLRSATTNAAKLLRMEGKIGTIIDEGAFADLLILDVNPLEDVTVLSKLEEHCHGIVKEGRVVMSKLREEGLEVDELYR